MAGLINDRILLVDLQCFPSINYYNSLVIYNTLKIEQYEHFKKGSYSNRYYLAGPNGKMLLSVPLLHTRRERMAFKDLKICNRDNWQRLHWRTITSAYRRSPWFEFYENSLQPMYEKKFDYLIDWNLEGFEMVNGWLGLSWDTSFTTAYEKSYKEGEMRDARHQFFPGKPIPGEPVKYRQVFEERTGFIEGLSILDLIFCEGKRAASCLQHAVG